MGHMTLEKLIVDAAESARPPERLTVSESAEKYRYLNNPGAYVGPWKNDTVPYMIEPMDELQSLDFTGWVFAGPAQCAKTDIGLNWLTHTVKCDPADMMIVEKSQTAARDFSMRRIDRLHRHSTAVGDAMVQNKEADNVFDKHYQSGMLLTLSWPTINELSGKPVPRLFLTDYDRMAQDVDTEGSPFDLARKRATTFGRFGMCAAESSPGRPVLNAKHMPATKHEAIPTEGGILELYNRGDRRRYYWKCVVCRYAFEPDFSLLVYPDVEDAMEAAENAKMRCPHCAAEYPHDAGGEMPGKAEMNRNGRWVKDGMVWLPSGEIVGTPIRSTIASFWLKGVCAAFSTWQTLVFNYITAERTYQQNGTEEALKTTVNTDQGVPYIPKLLASDRSPEELKGRARGVMLGEVPRGVRFLVACIDVQKNRFVVQVVGVHQNGDFSVVDRFDVKKSRRLDSDGEHLWVNPGAYHEDWKLLCDDVMGKTYPLSDGSKRHMAVRFTVCDSGGKAGVTANAYDFVRWLRDPKDDDLDVGEEQGEYLWRQEFSSRFMLLKGASMPTAPRVKIDFPDSQRKDRFAGARGEIPVAFLNTNLLKDTLNNMLDRKEAGGRVNFPNGLPDNFYTELTVEVKDPAKGWINPKRFRNESWDLLAYAIAACLLPQINFENIHFDSAPGWAEDWDDNDLVFHPETDEKPFDAEKKPSYGFAALARDLA